MSDENDIEDKDATFAKKWVEGPDVQYTSENTLDIGLCMATQVLTEGEPVSWRSALTIPDWKDTRIKEKNELELRNKWALIDPSPNVIVLPGLWRFKAKRNETGQITKYKARWCVNGARDFTIRAPEEVYAHLAEMTTVR